jgi:molybdopterin-guanine dinucleotide biosynthesis protein A
VSTHIIDTLRTLSNDARNNEIAHDTECWANHPLCAIAYAADVIERLETFIDQDRNRIYDH